MFCFVGDRENRTLLTVLSVTDIIVNMAHTRKRLVDGYFEKLLKFSPVIGVFGHRQVGKTTFCESIAIKYQTFDDPEVADFARNDPKSFVGKMCTDRWVIDESQMVPEIFPVIKDKIRRFKNPAQYILTGSVRFTSRKASRESLAGRMDSLEMFPMCVAELDERPLPDAVDQLLEESHFTKNTLRLFNDSKTLLRHQKSLEKYLKNGGLPGICFLRQERLQQEKLFDLHRLILDRDLRMVHETKISLERLLQYLRMIAQFGLDGYSYAEVTKKIRISPNTQKELLYAFESIFLIRRVSIYPRSGEIILLEDQFEERIFSDSKKETLTPWITALYRNIRTQFSYRMGKDVEYFSYWTRSNARVPLVVKRAGNLIGIIVIKQPKPTLSEMRAAESFLRHEPTGKVLFLTTVVSQTEIIEERILITSAAQLV